VAAAEGAEVELEVAAGAVGGEARIELVAGELGLAGGAADQVRREGAAEIEDGAVRGGDRDAGAAGEVVGFERGAVDADAGAGTPAGVAG
jgi:hypothetical protein